MPCYGVAGGTQNWISCASVILSRMRGEVRQPERAAPLAEVLSTIPGGVWLHCGTGVELRDTGGEHRSGMGASQDG
jgi:hypothetical protein